MISFSHGPTTDGRVKPDVLMPMDVDTASSDGDTATQLGEHGSGFGGTCAAGAFGMGWAATAWNEYYDASWFYGLNTVPDMPGRIYAHALRNAAFDQAHFTDLLGAGLVREDGSWCEHAPPTYGSVLFQYGSATGVTICFTGRQIFAADGTYDQSCATNANVIDAAVWWSEAPGSPHVPFRMELRNPAGALVATSDVQGSAWGKVRYVGTIANGADSDNTTYQCTGATDNWTVRIFSSTAPAPGCPIKVYFEFTAHRR